MKRYTFGLILILLGGLLFLDAMGILILPGWETFWSYWPLLLVGLGVFFLVRGDMSFLSFFLVLIGIFYSLRLFEIDPFTRPAIVWPAYIIVAGLSLVLSSTFSVKRVYNPHGTAFQQKKEKLPPKASRVSDVLDESVVLSGKEFAVFSDDFRGGELSTLLGGMEVDLRGVQLQNNALLYLRCTLGGLEVTLPADLPVHIVGKEILGGVEIHMPPEQGILEGPVLTIDYHVTLGGIEIRK